MKRIILLLTLIAVTFAAVSCQDTPDEPFVISKGDGKLQERISDEGLPELQEPYPAPESWTEEIAGKDKISANIDAKIYVPDTRTFPVYRVTPEALSQEFIDMLFEYFIGDEKIYNCPDWAQRTKSEVLEEIIRLQTRIADLGNPNSEEYREEIEHRSAEEIENELIPSYEEWLQNLQSEYASAPEERIMEEVSRDLKLNVSSAHGDYRIESVMGFTEDLSAMIDIRRSQPPYESVFQTVCVDLEAAEGVIKELSRFSITHPTEGEGYALLAEGESIEGLKYTYDEALGLANGIIEELGQPYSMIHAFKDDLMYKDYYVFYYTPALPGHEGLKMEYYAGWYGDLTMPWLTPYILVYVGDNGVSKYASVSSLKFGEMLNSNVALLPFEEIQDICRSYITVAPIVKTIVADEGEEPIMQYVNITDIRLGYIKVSERDNIGVGLCMPVWMFYGHQVGEYLDQEHSGWILDENNQVRYNDIPLIQPFLCINAVDGSIIDLTQGY